MSCLEAWKQPPEITVEKNGLVYHRKGWREQKQIENTTLEVK